MDRIDLATLNGTVNHTSKAKGKGKASKAPRTEGKASKPRRATLKGRQRLALAIGGVGVSVLALSLWHCTTALATLTGSPLFLAALLAIGIDAGMVAAELAHIAADGAARTWAARYVGTAVALSVALNALASAQHAERLTWLAALVGGIIPLLVYMLARVAGHLWRD